MSTTNSLRPDSRRLQSLRRARGRKLEARDAAAEQRPRWRTVLVHPVFIGAVAAVLGLVSGLVSSRVNADLEMQQYWREQRFGVYAEYIDSYKALHGTVRPVVMGIVNPSSPRVRLTKQKMQEIDDSWLVLTERRRSFDILADYDLANLADGNYSTNETMIQVLRASCLEGLSTDAKCRKAVAEFVELSGYLDNYLPGELQYEAQKDLGMR